MTALIELENVGVTFSTRSGFVRRFQFDALSDVSFALDEGETLGVVGRNGCGKSTLLRLLAGIVRPTTGTVNCASSVRRSLLSLGLGFRPDLTGADNALLGLMFQGCRYSEAKKMLAEIEAFADIGEHFNQPMRSYSSGMRSRLGFATAISANLDVMLLDELLSVGDAEFKLKAENALQGLIKKRTVVFVSHSLEQILQICDRVVWLKQGRVELLGDPKAVVSEYRQASKAG
jgi:lipopolysaccharide transport system ATP-binding protein